MLRVTFLGTASSRPTVRRNVSAIAVRRGSDAFLFDCGEGTQRQMMRFGVGFRVGDIFVTHLHADHYLGITGLLRTLSLQGREEPLGIWGPPGSFETLRRVVELGGDRLVFPVNVRELPPGESVGLGEYRIEAFSTRHTSASTGLALIEEARLGRFDPERAKELGVPEGPLFGRLHEGRSVETPEGRTVTSSEVVSDPRPGRRLVYTGDTRPCDATVEMAREADLLIHEATFGEEESARARDTGHSTARQAAGVAAEAGVRRLILTHFSARYSEQAHRLQAEARSVFSNTTAVDDGAVLELPLRDGGQGGDGWSKKQTGAGSGKESGG